MVSHALAFLARFMPKPNVAEVSPSVEVLRAALTKAKVVLMPEEPFGSTREALSALHLLMAQLYPGRVAQMVGCCGELLERLDLVSEDAITFERAFSGKGPFAQRLEALTFYERLLSPKDARATQALALFDYRLEKDPASLERLQTLVSAIHSRVAPHAVRWIPSRYFTPDGELLRESGFYGATSPFGVVYLCHLHAKLDNGVELVATATAQVPFSLYAKHPEEDRWFQSDLTSVIPGSLEALQKEYDRALGALELLQRDSPATLELPATLERAWRLLANIPSMPEDWFAFARTEGAQRGMIFTRAPTYLYVAWRLGEERVFRVMRGYNQSGFFFSIPFTELTHEEQTMLLTQAHRDMDDIETYAKTLPAERV